LQLQGIELDFGSFSQLSRASGRRVDLKGDVTSFEVSGLDGCQATAIENDPDFESDEGPMLTKVVCHSAGRTVTAPFTIAWSLVFQ
jgi:hypothetical protein